MIRNEFEKVVVLPIREKTALEMGILVPDETLPFVQAFVDFIKSYFENAKNE